MLQKIISNTLNSKECMSIALAIATVVISFLYYKIKNRGLPPGPVGLPYFGFWPFLRKENAHVQLMELQKKYGDLMSFTVTGHLYINLPSAKLLREVNVNHSDSFIDRIEDWTLLTHSLRDGLAFSNGERWKVIRKFSLGQLKQSMLSTKGSPEGMYDSVKAAIEDLKTLNGAPVKIMDIFGPKCSEILRGLIFGESDVTVEQLNEINASYAIVMHGLAIHTFLLVGEFARSVLFPFMDGYRDIMAHHDIVEDRIFKIIDNHKATYQESHIRDVIDSYIKEKKDRLAKGDPTAKYFTDRALMATLYQIIGDGILSVAAFVCVFLTAAAQHPEEQEKIYHEIVEVVGLERLPTMDDKSNMPYTNAFIYELLRTSDFFPVFPSLQCRKETTIAGYRIPKGAITLMNLYAAHHDPRIYENPEKFDPSRFVPKEGKPRSELPVTFGIGKRACMGEGFTMAQIFLFLSSVIQNFNLTPASTEKITYENLATGEMLICAHPRRNK